MCLDAEGVVPFSDHVYLEIGEKDGDLNSSSQRLHSLHGDVRIKPAHI